MSNGPGSCREYGSDREPCPLQLPTLTLHVDADRDGVADDHDGSNLSIFDSWQAGPNTKGAIILVNNDNDGGPRGLDNRNRVVDGSGDEADLAPALIKRRPPGLSFPAGWSARLTVSDPSKIRIFKRGSWLEVLGPRRRVFRIPDLNFTQPIELGMEAIQYPGIYPDHGFDGLLRLTLEVRNASNRVHSTQSARIRVAPWLMPNHLDKTEEIYIVRAMFNRSIRQTLADEVGGMATITTPPMPFLSGVGDDRWFQDIMEVGFSRFPPDHAINVAMPTANRRRPSFDLYPRRRLLGADYGYVRPVATNFYSSLNSFGNLECSPPVTVNGREYKFGRIYYGHDARRRMHWGVRRFLQRQRVQEPFPIDTSWLYVGHVDEVCSMIPWRSSSDIPGVQRHFRVALASPRYALEIIQQLVDVGQQNAQMFTGESWGFDRNLRTPGAIMRSRWFQSRQRRAQRKIDGVKQQLVNGLGLSDTDFIEIPVLFRPMEDGRYLAYTCDSVNMLVVTRADKTAKLMIPKPLGPIIDPSGDACVFEQEIESVITGSGNEVVFVRVFREYHRLMGELHCGTNSRRRPPADVKWWEQVGVF